MIMNLIDYYDKNVQIVTSTHRLIGLVTDYFYPEDNPNHQESIIILTPENESIEVHALEILSIFET